MRTFFNNILTVFLIACSGVLLTDRAAECKRIVFFTPTSENNTYWPQVFRVLKAVARDLDLEIDIHEFDVGDRYAKHLQGVKILNQHPRPDGAIFSVAYGNSKPLLTAAETLKIPVFIQGPVFPAELPGLGEKPRNKFKMWIGYFFQDEQRKGYLLGKTLLKKAHDLKLNAQDGMIHVAGIGGDPSWFGSMLRKKGLIRAVAEDPKAKMLQVVPTLWTESEGTEKTRHLLTRYPELAVIWAASDQLGIGAAKALEASGKTMGLNALTGGLDLSLNGLSHVKSGQLTATVAASTLEYAEVVIYLFDYLHGIDFAEEKGTEIGSTLHIATKANAERFIRLYKEIESIDFAAHSKALNPSLTHYDFTLEHLKGFRPRSLSSEGQAKK